MDAWYKVVTPRKEVREGRSFNPDEFAIALEQIVAGTAPEDYRDPKLFFSRTCFTRALREHSSMVLRRLSGKTQNTAPVMTLITQFGGGKTHTLATLLHLAKSGPKADKFEGVAELLKQAELPSVPAAKVAVFVGNAWDPQPGRETPWIDLARQLAGDKGVAELGKAAKETPPGTDALVRIFQAADAPVLILFDEVLNFMSRHTKMADHFHAFLHSLTVACTGASHATAVISLPRSQVEMTETDMQWQEKINKVVRRVAQDLIANDETEISEVVRRRLFEDLGNERIRKNVSKSYADWCFDKRAQLPSQWTAVDTTSSEAKAKEFLRSRFEACYPFHPATLSVFQRKWQALAQFQQTRGTLAMLAQWVSVAYKNSYQFARNEALITLGSAPLEVPEFRAVVLGQLGEPRLMAAIDADISGENSHARGLDADQPRILQDIHRRVGTAIFFESSGGQKDKAAHLPELRFAICNPEIDTTTVDNSVFALEDKSYFIRKVSSDGFKISHQATLRKIVNDRRASLDDEKEVRPAMLALVKEEFERGAANSPALFPKEGADVADTPKLTLVVMPPDFEWSATAAIRKQLAEWSKVRGKSPRLYPGALVWCMKREGRELRERVEVWLAWERVVSETQQGHFGTDIDPQDRNNAQAKLREAKDAARDAVWADYRFAVLTDNQAEDGLKVIDLGAGHSSQKETMYGRMISALRSQGILSEGAGAGYISRNWPVALKESGAWPLSSLRQSFLNGALTRLPDPDRSLTDTILDAVSKGELGLASNLVDGGSYEKVWFEEVVPVADIRFESDIFLLTQSKSVVLKKGTTLPAPAAVPDRRSASQIARGVPIPSTQREDSTGLAAPVNAVSKTIRITGDVPSEVWNKLGTRVIPKLKVGTDLSLEVQFTVSVPDSAAETLKAEIRQILEDLNLGNRIRIE